MVGAAVRSSPTTTRRDRYGDDDDDIVVGFNVEDRHHRRFEGGYEDPRLSTREQQLRDACGNFIRKQMREFRRREEGVVEVEELNAEEERGGRRRREHEHERKHHRGSEYEEEEEEREEREHEHDREPRGRRERNSILFGGSFVSSSRPSERCCRSLERIPAEERCSVMKEVYGGLPRREESEERHLRHHHSEEEEEEEHRRGHHDDDKGGRHRRRELLSLASSRLLQQCNLRPRACSSRRESSVFY